MDFTYSQDLIRQTNPNYDREFVANLDRKLRQPSLSGLFFREGNVTISGEARAKLGARVSQRTVGGGWEIQMPVITSVPDVTQAVNPLDTATVPIQNYTDSVTFGMGMARSGYAWCVMDADVNRGEAALANIASDVMLAERAALDSHFVKQHIWLWDKPANSADLKTPPGIGLFMVRNDTTEGLTGDVPAGYTTVGGLTHANWKNRVRWYVNPTTADLFEVIREEAMEMKYAPRPAGRGLGFDNLVTDASHICVTGKRNWLRLGPIIQSLNSQQKEYYSIDVNGNDVTIAGMPFLYDDRLDATDPVTGAALFPGYPVYMFDLSTWQTIVLGMSNGGRWWYHRSPEFSDGHQPLAKVSFIWSCYGVYCMNRMFNSIIYVK